MTGHVHCCMQVCACVMLVTREHHARIWRSSPAGGLLHLPPSLNHQPFLRNLDPDSRVFAWPSSKDLRLLLAHAVLEDKQPIEGSVFKRWRCSWVDASSSLLDELLPCPSYRVPSSSSLANRGRPRPLSRSRKVVWRLRVASLVGFRVEERGRFAKPQVCLSVGAQQGLC